jgi:pepF/M3 family oligoendopeptidase
MDVIFPGLTSPEFEQGFTAAVQATQKLETLFDDLHISRQETSTVDDTVVQNFEKVSTRYNAVLDQIETLATYIICFVDTDSQNSLAQAKLSELQATFVRLSQLGTRFTAWLGSLNIDELIKRSQMARNHTYMLQRAKERATHMMSPAEEALASELNVSSGTAWSRLHSNITSQLSVPVTLDGQTKEYPMSEVRNMAYSPDRTVRRTAYEAELAAWKRSAVPLAAAINSIKNESLVLAQKRHWDSPLADTLSLNSIDQATLDALFSAVRKSFPDFRRYLKAKARLLGLEKLAWYDLLAPVIESEQSWSFEDAKNFIVTHFGSYSQRLSDFAARAFRESWIDAAPRPGKVGGAYCAQIRKGESRILANYIASYDGASTLAHELGHGYHNLNLRDRTALQSTTPMTLAETASIFCETIIRSAALQSANQKEQLNILEFSLLGSCQVVVDVAGRFIFEQAVFEKRKQRELSVDELNELMLDAQKQTYGDGLDENALHPYMWAVKGHYYSAELPYYNYPYIFGLLFGLGLYARYQKNPEEFKRSYDDLLSSTGMADAATLADRFGIDIRDEAFWTASLDIIREDINTYEKLVSQFA